MPKVNGPLLRRARKRRDESVEQAAPSLGIKPGSLRNVENMRGVASDRLIGRLAEYYGLDEKDIRTLPKPVTVPRAAKKRPVLKARSAA